MYALQLKEQLGVLQEERRRLQAQVKSPVTPTQLPFTGDTEQLISRLKVQISIKIKQNVKDTLVKQRPQPGVS